MFRRSKRAWTLWAVKGRSGVFLSSLRSADTSSGLSPRNTTSPATVSASSSAVGSFARTALGGSTRGQRRESRPTFGCRRSNTEQSPNPSEMGETRRL